MTTRYPKSGPLLTILLAPGFCFAPTLSGQAPIASTSRVYPWAALNALAYEKSATRFALTNHQSLPGASDRGVNEDFPLVFVDTWNWIRTKEDVVRSSPGA
jgi:hypothetical protein